MAKTTERDHLAIPDYITVRDLAELMEASPIDVIKELMSNGIMASINQQIDYDTAAIVASEMGFEPEQEAVLIEAEQEEIGRPSWRQLYKGEDPSELVDRPPVVTVLGHVDHGKTSLLDRIREDNVQEGEAGGITQHIGAYQIQHGDRRITFLDTPGHEAFTEMRARGAQGADIAVLVVAADDGVMPQTREALAHARAASVPILVALNKIDRSNANPELVKQQLAEVGLVPDEWDGETMVVPVSAVTGEGLDDLLEAIVLVAEQTEIKANPKGEAAGTVLEAELEKNRGVMTTLLIQNGTLNKGDVVLAGTSYGRIKAMFNELGNPIDSAGPSTPARIMGLNEVPVPGTLFKVVKNEKTARSMAEELADSEALASRQVTGLTLEELYARFQAGEAKALNLIIKTDVQGSIDPITSSLEKISVEEDGEQLKINILLADVGNISESDVMLASTSDAVILGFNVEVDTAARRRADSESVEIRTYQIIYKLLEEVEQALVGMLEPVYEDATIGVAEVRQVFKVGKLGQIAGCYIRDGEARRKAEARVIRNKQILHQGSVASLRRFQEDVREVRTGFECGVGVTGFSDFKEGDLIQFVVRERVR